MTVNAALLPHRSVLEVAGEDRVSFLQGLVTSDVEGLTEGEGRFAGLLSPQGKILFDFFVVSAGDAFLVDCSSDILRMLLNARFVDVIVDLTLRFHSIRSVLLLLADLIDRSLNPALSALGRQRRLAWL